MAECGQYTPCACMKMPLGTTVPCVRSLHQENFRKYLKKKYPNNKIQGKTLTPKFYYTHLLPMSYKQQDTCLEEKVK